MKRKKMSECNPKEPRMESEREGQTCAEKKKKRKRMNNIMSRRRTKTEDIRDFFGTEDSH